MRILFDENVPRGRATHPHRPRCADRRRDGLGTFANRQLLDESEKGSFEILIT